MPATRARRTTGTAPPVERRLSSPWPGTTLVPTWTAASPAAPGVDCRGGRRPGLSHPLRRRVLACLLPLAAVLLSACSAGTGASSAPGPSSVVTEVPPAHRQQLTPVTGRLLSGGSYDSRRLQGHIVVYNVWGSWCAPCRKEAPVLRRVAEGTRSRGVRFVGLDTRDNDTAARAFERRYGITYPSMRSADSAQALLVFGPVLPASAIPSTVIIDERGRVAARVVGATTYPTLSGLVQDALARNAAGRGRG